MIKDVFYYNLLHDFCTIDKDANADLFYVSGKGVDIVGHK
ncbi:hypothetical protein CLV62_12955 [Dysgonomonas alginatilytica]|uniref:Uncharacterized protein n=1 Tax=Dysgonomonas alginatilytica TaxID=1605892 RepID=A0A2V3PLM1_9BACT|nr:hypothetical protein CLV62_12955 [Dysgonomonas alginatilytica]